MKKNGCEMGGVAALVLGVILGVWMNFIAGIKTCGRMIASLLRSARKSITTYLTGSDEDRTNLTNSLKSTLMTSAMALAIVLVGGVCINILFDALIRSTFTFIPAFLMNAIGYLTVGILLRVVVRMAEKLNMRIDVTNKARKIIEFVISAMVPVAICAFITKVTAEAIWLILSCCIASWGYRKINEVRASMATAEA